MDVTSSAMLAAAAAAMAEGRLADAELLASRARDAGDADTRAEAERLLARVAGECFDAARAPDHVPERYHRWYYDRLVWKSTSWCGVETLKSVSDMWNYQEIIAALRPALVVEFGTFRGGSALFFAHVQRACGLEPRVLTVDIASAVAAAALREPAIEFMTCSSTAPEVAARIAELRAAHAGPAFVILDSDHAADHVEAELESLRAVTVPGDYVIVEDTNVNGHPVLPDFGAGPHEGLDAYLSRHPEDYVRDRARERKFGFTFATDGFLIRR